jgi:Helix-turn-helix domain
MTWAWTLQLPPTPKFVLMALADDANDDGYCYPSHRRIAQKCSITERSVRRMIEVLCAKGYVVVRQRFHNRARTSNGYQLKVDDPRTNCPGGADPDVQGDRTQVSRGSGHACPGPQDNGVRVTTTDPSVDPIPPPQRPRRGSPELVEPVARNVCGGGDLCFPRGLSILQRQALAERLGRLNLDDAQNILDELAGRMACNKVDNPLRYCMALVQRLRQGKFHLEVGLPIAERRAAERLRDQVLRAQWTTSDLNGGTPTPAIPENARAVFDRLRQGSTSELRDGDSDGVQSDARNATDASH